MIRVQGRLVEFHPSASIGMSLAGSFVLENGRHSQYLARDSQAVDKAKYWNLWKRLGGITYQWEDGTPFDPSE